MTQYILRRFLASIFVVWAVISLVFLLVFEVGDPAATALGPQASSEQIAQFERREGLDHSLGAQYLSYLGVGACVREISPHYDDGDGRCGLLQFDLGESYRLKEPVAEIIRFRLPRTLLLGVMALFFELLIGLSLGIFAATQRNKWPDNLLMAGAYLGISLPTYVTGPIFLLGLAFMAGIFPVGGYGVTPLEHVYHAVLPAFTLAIVGAATYARVMRSELIDTLRSDYVRTARAKGLGSRAVLGHALKNALLPIVTLVGLSFAMLVSGAIITEKVFAWPGMGSLAIEAVTLEDAPIIMGVVVVFSLAVQLGNFLADLAVASLDPRIRLSK